MQKKAHIPANLPNILTIFRIGITGLLLYLLFVDSVIVRTVAAGLFLVAVVTDFLDGYLARKYNLVSDFGKIADPIADKILFLGLFAVYASLGIFSPWWLIPLFAREIFVTIARLLLLAKGKVIAAESAGKIKVGFQVASLCLAWIVLMMRQYGSNGVGISLYVLFYFSLLGAVGSTVYSGVLFVMKNDRGLADVGFARLLGTFFFFGNHSVMPGTIGTIGGVLLYCALPHDMTLIYCGVLALLFILGVWSSRRMAEHLEHEDPSCVVIDEVVGLLCTFLFIKPTVLIVVVGFVLFRFFDILKPWPIHRFEHIPHGYGIMFDDIIAGIFSNVILHFLIHFVF